MDKIFKSGRSSLSRGELESLPCPVCTKNVTDKTMQLIVDEIEAEMQDWYEWLEQGDVSEDKVNEKWWEIMEEVVCALQIPYYEELWIEQAD